MAKIAWHRVFHPLCGSDLRVLLTLLARNGAPSARGVLPVLLALACGVGRLPFTLGERAWLAYALPRAAPVAPPVFIVGHMRSGTTHLHNLLAASGQFATVPPVLAGMPLEAHGLARILRPFIDPYLPENRLIDDVPLLSDSPTEDEVALANLLSVSYYHAIYFPRRFREQYERGLFPERWTRRESARLEAGLRHYVTKMSALGGGGPLLLKNPAYTTRIRALRALWPEARFIHIYRDPYVVHQSTRRALRTVLRELALQDPAAVPVDRIVLDVYPRMMDRLFDDAAALPQGRIAHVRFERLEADPRREIAGLYRALELPAFADAWPRIEAYLHSIRGYRKTRHAFTRADVDLVSRRWGRYVTRLGYATPEIGPADPAPSPLAWEHTGAAQPAAAC